MKIIFGIKEEATVVNNTIKVNCAIGGVIGGDTKEQIDARVLISVKRLFPEAEWSFANYQELTDGFTFRVNASARVEASENERLDERTEEAGDKVTTIMITDIDNSIPQRQIREEESNLRLRMIELAKAEAEKLSGEVEKIDFCEIIRSDSQFRGARYMGKEVATMFMDSSDAMQKRIGHSEKISLEAKLEIVTA